MKHIDFKALAARLRFGFMPITYVVKSERLQYRKGHNIQSIINAWQKAKKNGNFKTEIELEWFELYLKQVFKTKTQKQETSLDKRQY